MTRVLALAVVSALLLLPGLGALLAIYPPGRIRVATGLALIPCLGYVGVAGSAYMLGVLGLLRPGSFLAVVGLGTLAVWYVALRRGSLREHARAALAEIRTDRLTLAMGAAVILAVAMLRWGFLSDVNIGLPFAYWADANEIARSGGMVDLSLQYGALYPAATSKFILNVFSAGVGFVVPNPLLALSALLWISAVWMATSLWAMGRELGLRFLAPLLPVLAMANDLLLGGEMTRDLFGYRAENIGRALAFAGVAVGVRAIRDRRRNDAVVAAVLIAFAAGTHLVPAVVAGALLGWYAVASVLLHPTRADIRAIVVLTAVIGGTAVLLFGGTRFGAGGEPGFEGASSQGTYTPILGLYDPTLYLHTGRFQELRPPRGPWYIPPGRVFEAYVGRTLGVSSPKLRTALSPVLGVLLPIAFVGAAAGILLLFPEPLRPIGVIAAGLWVTLFLVALYFSLRYEVHILAWFGVRRTFDYGTLPFLLLLLAGGEAALGRFGSVRLRSVVAVVAVALVTVIALPTARHRGGGLSPDSPAILVLDWVRQNTECEARILTNRRTVGVFKVMTGRVAVLEGMGPFVRPEMLGEVVDKLLDARAFFESGGADRDYLEKEGVDYVVVLKDVVLGDQGPIGRNNPEGPLQASFLRPMLTTTYADVYQVIPAGPRSSFPDPATLPGIRCIRTPVDLWGFTA